MKKAITLLFILIQFPLFAGPGDTTWVQTFTFDTINNRRATFSFPDASKDYQKVWMYYRLKCDPQTTQDKYNCGEWDYLTYTYVYDHTGDFDSTKLTHVNYIVDGATPDKYDYTNKTIWEAHKKVKMSSQFIDTVLVNSAIGSVSGSTSSILNTTHTASRIQFQWTKDELSTAINSPTDPITSILLNLTKADGANTNITIRMKNTTKSFELGNRDSGNWVTVYDQPFSSTNIGPNQFQFINPFVWDGSSNVIVEILSDNKKNGASSYEVEIEDLAKNVSIGTKSNNIYLDFEGADAIILPNDNFNTFSSEITIALWTFGDPDIQPQNNITFEGLDSDNARKFNAHLPWSNGQVYWDAGSVNGSTDRINKAANESDYKGKWNHWAFTKNTSTGSMKIYLNGVLWHSGTGKTKTMSDLQSFVLGSRGAGPGNGNNSYDGFIDQFAMWNKELDANEIQNVMNGNFDGPQSSYSNLQYHFDFNQEFGSTANDSKNPNMKAIHIGTPQKIKTKALELWNGFKYGTERPVITFQQGQHKENIVSISYFDTTILAQKSVVLYENFSTPNIPTDTLYGWEAGYSYTYDEFNNPIDSVFSPASRTFIKTETPYFSTPFEVINRYELARYITPYGINLDLGPNGFLWMFDVTDYQDLLTDLVDLEAHNRQELIDLKFAFIEGEPARNPIKIENIYNGTPTYSTDFEDWAKPIKYYVSQEAERVVVKLRLTGHGFGGNENCSEFCSKRHNIKINGEETWARYVWRDDCGYNPVQPQGGTWVYNRANWCPGAEVETYEVDITDYIVKGDSVEIDYSAEAYTWNGQGSRPYYRTEIQVLEFKDAPYTIDASIEHIFKPSTEDLYSKRNPICGSPEIVIQNNGKDNLKSVGIYYGLEGESEQFYYWEGNLGFLEKDTIFLLPLNWDESGKEFREFKARLESPNKSLDQNPSNDFMESTAELPMILEPFIIELKTNNNPDENEYFITNVHGEVLFHKQNMNANTLYKDTFLLEDGCYNFTIIDAQENGLSWWAASAQGGGFLRFRRLDGQLMQTFDSDFGAQISQNFIVGKTERFEDLEVFVYNNPSDGIFLLDVPTIYQDGYSIDIYNSMGQKVKTIPLSPGHSQTIELDISGNTSGMYFAHIQMPNVSKTVKLMLK